MLSVTTGERTLNFKLSDDFKHHSHASFKNYAVASPCKISLSTSLIMNGCPLLQPWWEMRRGSITSILVEGLPTFESLTDGTSILLPDKDPADTMADCIGEMLIFLWISPAPVTLLTSPWHCEHFHARVDFSNSHKMSYFNFPCLCKWEHQKSPL